MTTTTEKFRRDEIDTIYVDDKDRYIVSLIVGYEDGEGGSNGAGCKSLADAARWALELTRDGGCDGTHWFVYDRATGEHEFFEQDQFDPEMSEYGCGCGLRFNYEDSLADHLTANPDHRSDDDC